jgi:trehalose 6-phosphate synthase/phosphatase
MEKISGRRLVVVSNRLPFKLSEDSGGISMQPSDGGLVSALTSYFDRPGITSDFDESVWIGAANFPQKRWSKYQRQKNEPTAFEVVPVFVDTKLYNRYYNGFCNSTLWPLFHYFPSYAVFDNQSFQAYEDVNRLLADAVLAIIRPGDVVWVHDYQLMLVPDMIRQSQPDVLLGFFLHIPFPSFEIFRLLHHHWRKAIITGVLGADLIGFHTHEYVQHFLKTVRMVIGIDHHYRTLTLNERLVRADLFPIGINFEKFHESTDEIMRQRDAIRQRFQDCKILFSVDRLDYAKGLTHRLKGLDIFLEQNPEWHEKVVFIFVVVPSREIISRYNERKTLLEEEVGRINGKYSTLQWQPVIYRYSFLPFDELSALYRAADMALITPLRDGMNLVSKEYVASREKDGVLILSELAGAASELSEALLVNPVDAVQMAETILEGLQMPVALQQKKIERMQARLQSYDVFHWVGDFLGQLNTLKEQMDSRKQTFLSGALRQQLIDRFKQASSRCLFLDYDGTLVPFAKLPHEAQPGEELLNLLQQLASQSDSQVAIISGRDSRVLQHWFGDIPVTLVAEHGASWRRPGLAWQHQATIDQSWKPLVRPTLDLFVQRCPGAFVEEKSHTLAWHYRNVERDLGFSRSRDLVDSLLHLVRSTHLQVLDGNKVIEVRVAGVDKGAAVRRLLEEQPGEFVLVIGDDRTDEDMFRTLRDTAVTIKVGAGATEAEYWLPSQREVVELLVQLTL